MVRTMRVRNALTGQVREVRVPDVLLTPPKKPEPEVVEPVARSVVVELEPDVEGFKSAAKKAPAKRKPSKGLKVHEGGIVEQAEGGGGEGDGADIG